MERTNTELAALLRRAADHTRRRDLAELDDDLAHEEWATIYDEAATALEDSASK